MHPFPSRESLEAVLRPAAQGCPFAKLERFYRQVILDYGAFGEACLGRVDRFYLFTVLLNRPDGIHPWIYARCREIEAAPDGYLDLWAREHYKSSLITFAGSIQEILRDSEITIGIFSHTKPTAKKFVLQIKEEFEKNTTLHRLYPEVLYDNPKRDAPEWSEEKGITVRRRGNPPEATLEAHGLVDGQPTGAHFRLRIYDDVVTLESVTTPEQVKKTTEAHDVSDNLGARSGDGSKRAWRVGTRYKFGDSYQDMIDRGSVKVRIYAATDDGSPTGKPVFLTQEQLDQIKKDQPSAIFAAQQLMNPAAGVEAMFQQGWLKFADVRPSTLNVYIMCDPASSRKKGRDNTAILVAGIDAGRNKWFLDGFTHKMGLSERWTKIKTLYAFWSSLPGVQFVKVGYERYGLTDALEYMEERMLIDKVGFPIEELAWPREGGNAKYDRIQRLEPDFRGGRWYLPAELIRTVVGPDGVERTEVIEETRNQREVRLAGQGYRVFVPVRRKDHEGNLYSLSEAFLAQYLRYPYVNHDDNLDCLSRIYDLDPAPPVLLDPQSLEPETYSDGA